MTRFFFVLVWLGAWPGLLFSAPVANLASLEGEVTVLRVGVIIPSEKLTDGFPLEAFDTVTTGATGRADIRLPASTGITGVIRLDQRTSLYLDLTSLKREQTVGIELLTGSVSVKISAAVGSSTVEVRTESGTFYGRGPAFRVINTPGGDVLATVSSGRVVCQVPGRTVFIDPGTVVQSLTLEQAVQTLPMNVSTLDAFESAWVEQRRQTLRDQAAVAFRTLASRYQLQVSQFQRAWDRVQREAEEASQTGSIANLRRAAFPLERSLFHIRALRQLLDTGGLSPSVELSRGYVAKEFFRQAAADDAVWSARLGEARGLYRSLAERSGGVFPTASDGTAITWDSDFFN